MFEYDETEVEVVNEKIPGISDEVKEKDIKKEEVKPSEPNFIQKFFQENALAKIGGILLFLSVVFLMQLVYTKIGPIGKLMIGFAAGFFVFVAGWYLDKKGFKKESKIVMGVAVLINYLVILSGRYLIGEGLLVKKTILNQIMTFFLLTVNTIFAVSVGMAFRSFVLMFFSIIVAFANPFLVGFKKETDPYTLIFYALAISLGAILLSVFYKKRKIIYSKYLLNASFIGGNILILVAPFHTNFAWIIKLLAMALLSFLLIFVAYRNKLQKLIGAYIIGAYVFFILLLSVGHTALASGFSGFAVSISCLSFMALMGVLGVVIFLFTSGALFFYTLIIPMPIILALFSTGIFNLFSLGFILFGSVLFYLMIFFKNNQSKPFV